MKVKPLGDRIVVRRFEADEKTAGGIILPDNAKNKPQKGKVLAVGPGKMIKDGSRRPLQVKEGETVIFTSWAGDEFKDNKQAGEILVMHEGDVLCVIETFQCHVHRRHLSGTREKGRRRERPARFFAFMAFSQAAGHALVFAGMVFARADAALAGVGARRTHQIDRPAVAGDDLRRGKAQVGTIAACGEQLSQLMHPPSQFTGTPRRTTVAGALAERTGPGAPIELIVRFLLSHGFPAEPLCSQ